MMKKLVCLLLAAVLLAVWTGVSLADVYASYSDGKLTVSTDEKGFWEISVDDEWIGYYLGNALPSTIIPMTLEQGAHSVTITNPDENRNLTVAIWVGESQSAGAAQPAAAPSGPIKLESARYEKGVIVFQLSGLRGSAEIWLDGEYTGASVTGKVVRHGKGEKIVILKYKSKKNYRRKAGHRQPFTQVEITGVNA